jgi:SAM-dependent methyltransferase
MEKHFEYIENDDIGIETLDVISGADNFNRWMYETIKDHCSGNILEIGSGLGNISRYFLDANARITLSDIRANYCNYLKENFKEYSNLQEVINFDLVDPDFDSKYKNYFNKFDTVFALNVIEHIKDDKLAIQNAKKLIKPLGKLVVLVPAYDFLYNNFDTGLCHYRRYNLRKLKNLYTSVSFNVTEGFYFNCVGMIGWYISGKLQGNKSIPKSQFAIYNKLVFLFRLADKLVFNRIGLSVIVIGSRT